MEQRICSVDRCQNPSKARGWCMSHYDSWRKYGDPLKAVTKGVGKGRGRPRMAIFSRVRMADGFDGCWEWTGPISERGYGVANGQAHRTVYELLVGPIPEGLQLDHLCHNEDLTCEGGAICLHRRCVNPMHLEPVTNQENALRSRLTLASINSAKTHCPSGHEFTPENTAIYGSKQPGRYCRQCYRDKSKRERGGGGG